LGLEPVDLLLLAPGFYVCSVLLSYPLAACVLTGIGGVALRLLKVGKLPGYSGALARYLVSPSLAPAFGRDVVIAYPATTQRRARGAA
jgi:hypothetical protein